MKKILIPVAFMALMLMQATQAAQVSDILTGLATGRENLVKMLDETDKAKQGEFKKNIETATKAADDALAAMLADAATSAETKAKLEEFKKTWEEFKKTRETDVIGALEAGKNDEAKKVATGIQAERIKTMKGLLEGIK